MRTLILLFLLAPLISVAQHKLTVEVSGVEHGNGSILVAVYDSEDSFLDSDKMFSGGSNTASEGETIVIIENLPKGEYALAIFHDENDNEVLDTNFIGIPKEPISFSIGKMKTFGPPPYKECSFKVEEDTQIKVVL